VEATETKKAKTLVGPCQELYEQNPAAMWRELKFAAVEKRMEVDDLLRGYSSQLDRFKSALLADLA